MDRETAATRAFRSQWSLPMDVVVRQLRGERCGMDQRRVVMTETARNVLNCAASTGHVEITKDGAMCVNEAMCSGVLPGERESRQRQRSRFITMINAALPELNAAMIWARRNWILEHLAFPVVKTSAIGATATGLMKHDKMAPLTMMAKLKRGGGSVEEFRLLVNSCGYFQPKLGQGEPEVHFVPLLKNASPGRLTPASKRLLMAMINVFDATETASSGKKTARYWNFFTPSADAEKKVQDIKTTKAAKHNAYQALKSKITKFVDGLQGEIGTAAGGGGVTNQVTLSQDDKDKYAEEVLRIIKTHQKTNGVIAIGAAEFLTKIKTLVVKAGENPTGTAVNVGDTEIGNLANREGLPAAAETWSTSREAFKNAKTAAKPVLNKLKSTEHFGLYARVLIFLHALLQPPSGGTPAFFKTSIDNRIRCLAKNRISAKNIVNYVGAPPTGTEEADYKTEFYTALIDEHKKWFNSKATGAMTALTHLEHLASDASVTLTGATPSLPTETEFPVASDREHWRIEFRDIDLRVAVVTGIETVFVRSILDENRFAVFPTALFAWSERLEGLAQAVQRHVRIRGAEKWKAAIADARYNSPEFATQLRKTFKEGGMRPDSVAPTAIANEELDMNLIEAVEKCNDFFQRHGDIRGEADFKAYASERISVGGEKARVGDVCDVQQVGNTVYPTTRMASDFLLRQNPATGRARVDEPEHADTVSLFRNMAQDAYRMNKRNIEERDRVLGK